MGEGRMVREDKHQVLTWLKSEKDSEFLPTSPIYSRVNLFMKAEPSRLPRRPHPPVVALGIKFPIHKLWRTHLNHSGNILTLRILQPLELELQNQSAFSSLMWVQCLLNRSNPRKTIKGTTFRGRLVQGRIQRLQVGDASWMLGGRG